MHRGAKPEAAFFEAFPPSGEMHPRQACGGGIKYNYYVLIKDVRLRNILE